MSARLETERLVLREPRSEDSEALLDFVGDAETMRWLGHAAGGGDLAAELLERWLGLELGWALTSGHRGRGYATEATLAVRDWARRERAVGRLISLIEPANAASARVAERLAARVEARVESAYGPMDVWVHP